jgi:hypothetical protein
MRLYPAHPGNPRRYIEGESPHSSKGIYGLGTFWVMLHAKLLPVARHGLPTETVVRSVAGKKSHNLQIAPQPGLD